MLASFESLESVALEFRGALGGFCSSDDAFACELLFREALTNSLVHGCCLDPARSASLVLRSSSDRVVIAVADDGPGFSWRAGLTRRAEAADTGGRGLEIYKAYAHRIRFNQSGNRLVLVRKLRREKPTEPPGAHLEERGQQ